MTNSEKKNYNWLVKTKLANFEHSHLVCLGR